ncbi:TPA: hypothetical protein ACJK7G_000358 [Acinetobacter baumannii]|nr:hypothetical protein [Acinetobacter baumannii]
MKKALFALAVLFLAGCEPSTKEKTGDFILPPDLKDCRIYNLSDGSSTITTMRCPNSSTATQYRVGKSTRNSIVVDGETYVREEGAK